MQEKAQGDAHDIEFEGSRVSVKDSLVGAVEGSKGPWMEDNNDLNPCWPTLLSGMCFTLGLCLLQFRILVWIIDSGVFMKVLMLQMKRYHRKGMSHSR